MIAHDDTLQLAQAGGSLAEQRELLERGLRERGFPDDVVAASIVCAKDGFILTPTTEATRSRAGGPERVRLPTGESWPTDNDRPLTFLFEIHADDLVGAAGVLGAPLGGSLLFFHAEEPGVWASFRSSTRVLFRADDDNGVETSTGSADPYRANDEVWLSGWACPTVDPADVAEELGPERVDAIDEGDEDLHFVLDELLPWNGTTNLRFLGVPMSRDGSIWALISNWFETPEAREEAEHFSESERRGEGWQLLLRPADILNFDWSTEGERFHVIPSADWAAKRFDRVITVFG